MKKLDFSLKCLCKEHIYNSGSYHRADLYGRNSFSYLQCSKIIKIANVINIRDKNAVMPGSDFIMWYNVHIRRAKALPKSEMQTRSAGLKSFPSIAIFLFLRFLQAGTNSWAAFSKSLPFEERDFVSLMKDSKETGFPQKRRTVKDLFPSALSLLPSLTY